MQQQALREWEFVQPGVEGCVKHARFLEGFRVQTPGRETLLMGAGCRVSVRHSPVLGECSVSRKA